MVYESRTQSEVQLENEIIAQLAILDYEKVRIPDIKNLLVNFRDQVNRLNEKNLEGTPLSDKECERLLLVIEGKSVYETVKLFRIQQTVSRDDSRTALFTFVRYTKYHL